MLTEDGRAGEVGLPKPFIAQKIMSEFKISDSGRSWQEKGLSRAMEVVSALTGPDSFTFLSWVEVQ